VSETVVIGVAGLVATLGGVILGYKLQEWAESDRRLRDACAKVIALALEACDHMIMEEVARSGGPPADPLRPEYRSDQYYAIASVGLASKTLAKAAEILGDKIKEAIVAQASADAGERDEGRQMAMEAIGAFRAAVAREV